MTVSTSGSTRGPFDGIGTVDWKALIRWRNRDGSTCCSFASARTEVSSIPAIEELAAVRSPTATATTSSSSSSSGGITPSVPSRYPPATPGRAPTG